MQILKIKKKTNPCQCPIIDHCVFYLEYCHIIYILL